MQKLCGMVTHTDEMIGDIVTELNNTGLLANSILIFMGDNGGPHIDKDPGPSRFDSTIIERNYPYRGQKHEIFEGGVHVAGFVYSPLLDAAVTGTSNNAVFHATDWAPTILALAKAAPLPNTDGFNVWGCLTTNNPAACERTEMVLNINLICDSPPPLPPNKTTCLKECLAANTTQCDCNCFCATCKGICGNGCYDKCATSAHHSCDKGCRFGSVVGGPLHVDVQRGTGLAAAFTTVENAPSPPSIHNNSGYYSTEAPAPKAGIRVGNHKLLVECFNASSQAIQGKVMLYDLDADPSESTNIAAENPDVVAKLSARIVFYGVQATVPMGDKPPWQGHEYYCASCPPGRPTVLSPPPHRFNAWQPWCNTSTDKPC